MPQHRSFPETLQGYPAESFLGFRTWPLFGTPQLPRFDPSGWWGFLGFRSSLGFPGAWLPMSPRAGFLRASGAGCAPRCACCARYACCAPPRARRAAACRDSRAERPAISRVEQAQKFFDLSPAQGTGLLPLVTAQLSKTSTLLSVSFCILLKS